MESCTIGVLNPDGRKISGLSLRPRPYNGLMRFHLFISDLETF